MFRLYLALSDTTLDEALEELALGGGVETEAEHPAAGENCERLIDDLTLARSSAENSIRGGIKSVTINKASFISFFQEPTSIQRRDKKR